MYLDQEDWRVDLQLLLQTNRFVKYCSNIVLNLVCVETFHSAKLWEKSVQTLNNNKQTERHCTKNVFLCLINWFLEQICLREKHGLECQQDYGLILSEESSAATSSKKHIFSTVFNMVYSVKFFNATKVRQN